MYVLDYSMLCVYIQMCIQPFSIANYAYIDERFSNIY